MRPAGGRAGEAEMGSDEAGRPGARGAAGSAFRRRALVAMLVLPSAGPAIGAEWIFEPSVAVESLYDDNVDLTPGDGDSVSGYMLVPRLRLRANTEVSKTTLDGYVAYTDYREKDVEDRSEVATYLTSERQVSERGKLDLRGEYRHDTLFERTDFGPGTGNIRDVDIGLSSSTQVRRHYWTLEPSWSWLLTERSAVRFGYRYTDSRYTNATGTGLVDYSEQGVSATWSRSLTDRDDLDLTLNASRFDPDIDEQSRTVQVLAGLRRAFSDTLRGSLGAGASRTRAEVGAAEDTSSGFVFTAGLEQRAETSHLDGVISSDITPSGLGRTVRSDQVRVRWTLQTTPTVDFVLQTHLLRTRALEGDDPAIDRRYYEVWPELRWQWLENVFVSGSYRYRRQKFDADPEAARSSAVFLGLAYSL